MPAQKKFAFAAVVLSLACSVLTVAQKRDEFASAQAQSAAKNPADVSFAVRTKGGQARFRQGELIRLELSFASGAADKYSLDAASARAFSHDAAGRELAGG